MKSIFLIAEEVHETYGHGSSGIELQVVVQGEFLKEKPFGFETREEAQDYLDTLKWKSGKKVVEIEIVSPKNVT
jgi:hypothetical protein